MNFTEQLKHATTQLEFEEISKQMNIQMTIDNVTKDAQQGRLGEDNNVLRNVRLYAEALRDVLDSHTSLAETGMALPRKMNTKLLLALGTSVVASATVNTVLGSSRPSKNKHLTSRDGISRVLARTLEILLRENMIKTLGDKDTKKDLKGVYKIMNRTTQKGDRKIKMAGNLVSKVYKKFSLKEPTGDNYVGFATDMIKQLALIQLSMGGELRTLIKTFDTHSVQGVLVILDEWFLTAYIDAIKDGRFVQSLYLPLIEKPIGFTGIEKGGHHSYFYSRLPRKRLDKDVKDPNDYTAINALQNTGFKIDKRILKAQIALYEAGIIAGNFEKLTFGGFDIPRPSNTLDGEKGIKVEQMSEKVLKDYTKWRKLAGAFYNEKERLNSIVGMQARNIATAKIFEDREEFFFAYYYDFRGRIYPRTSSLSPQGACESKSLLQYAKGSLMTEELAKEFLANGASLFGHDKLSFADRLSWALGNTKMFMSCANNYMDDLRWAEEPKEAFMALQFCFDVRDYWNTGTGFMYHSMIPLDGTCNGLQHLAAMTHDELSGKQVNLLNYPRQDIYQDVADDLILNLQRLPEAWAKDVLKANIITRKFTKRSVMTKPYNVGKVTVMNEHVGGFLKDPKNKVQYLKEDYPTINSDLGGLLWDTMDSGNMRRPNLAMEWFGHVEKVLIDHGYKHTTWLSPNGFTVKQRYIKFETISKETSGIGGERIIYQTIKHSTKPNNRKRKNGLAPNFIHSMDAAHLQLTITLLEREGVKDFWFIHDSFSVPLEHTKLLKRVLREAFITIYKDANWFKDFTLGLPQIVQENIEWFPEMGELDFDEIMKSENFFA